VQGLTKGVPILYNSPAARVHYGTSGVTVVTTQGRAITADACIVTVPLGVLKANKIDFFPPLPKAKANAIKRLGCDPPAGRPSCFVSAVVRRNRRVCELLNGGLRGMVFLCRFGVLNKVAMLFETQWWGPHDTFGHVADVDKDEQPGWCYLWYTYPQGISGVYHILMHCHLKGCDTVIAHTSCCHCSVHDPVP
jgi:Flavin containing amine oxidoreductase